ncbi:hypothetical protein ACN1C3_31050 [Pseudomonas sp. H11T01]|uniref:hypothetical protein n=1 Tax=Pseudomonas sp. H11T01 TaxID=3402749 RepID=UPI003AD08B79
MPVLHIDPLTRRHIRQALHESTDERKAVRAIALDDGQWLLMLALCGNVSFSLIADADDLFNPHLMVDVSALVLADLERHHEADLLQS